MHHPPSLIVALAHLFFSGVSVFIVAKLLPGVQAKSLTSSIAFAFVVAVLNVIAWWLLAPLTLPFKWLTLGVGGFIINGVIFMLAARIVGGVKVSGCVMAAIAAFCVTLVNQAIQHVIGTW
ncbi:putative membrane protein [Minicystis rosea]|nr:putative membrane protein [Minicystis rosea]